ncbi:MAG: hypothetical protein GXO66_00165, partial [Euryarchaeota archaeon]|nr:hypothetical protein [Euryarchaeota archaeon]
MAVSELFEKIADRESIEKDKLMTLSLIAYLKDKKKEYMKERLEVLRRYGVGSAG